MGEKERHTLTIADESKVVTIDLTAKQGIFMPKPNEPKNFLHLSQEDIDKFKIKEVGEFEIAGKTCKRYNYTVTQEDQTYDIATWIWEGISLKQEAGMNGTIFMIDEAKKIEENVTIPADKFVVPDDVEIYEQKEEE